MFCSKTELFICGSHLLNYVNNSVESLSISINIFNGS